jgi:Tol biopolymer transport system component
MNTMGRGFRFAITLLILISVNLGEEAQGQRWPDAATTERVSVGIDGTEADSGSEYPSMAAFGCCVAFVSYATNLIEADTNINYDVFVHDRTNNETSRVSVASDGTQGDGESGYYGLSISGDGSSVAFESTATNLVTGDSNNKSDIFVHDRESGITSRVSVASDGSQADGFSYSPIISADGRFVAFHSYATNLVSQDTNGKSDVFIHELETGETTRVSIDSQGNQGNGDSWQSAVSADGSLVVFLSSATNLASGDQNGYRDVFVHDRSTGETTRVSLATDGTEANQDSGYPAISADGQWVAFESKATNLVAEDANGIVVDIYLHDRLSGATSLVSLSSSGEQGTLSAYFPSISADGRYVSFDSASDNLASNDSNLASDIFIRDLEMGETLLVSMATDGTLGDKGSAFPSISADGRFTAFQSSATNLVDGDIIGVRDIFVRDQGEEWFTYSITGTVTEESGAPLSGAQVSCDCGTSGVTGLDGSYLISDVLSGTYTLTATLDGYIFSPIWQVVSVPPDAAGVNFAATRENLLTALPIVVK